MKKLKGEGLAPGLLTLDVASEESIAGAKDSVEKKYGRLDVLINNAAVLFRVCVVTSIVMRTQICARHHVVCLTMTHFILYAHTHTHTRPHTQMDSGMTLYEKAKQTIATNYCGVLKVTSIFSPLLQPNSRQSTLLMDHNVSMNI